MHIIHIRNVVPKFTTEGRTMPSFRGFACSGVGCQMWSCGNVCRPPSRLRRLGKRKATVVAVAWWVAWHDHWSWKRCETPLIQGGASRAGWNPVGCLRASRHSGRGVFQCHLPLVDVGLSFNQRLGPTPDLGGQASEQHAASRKSQQAVVGFVGLVGGDQSGGGGLGAHGELH